jgi:glycerophosphoryl diester phosphodiesterase
MTQAPIERLSLRRRAFSDAERGRVWVIGHRGAMGHCPENTFVSFERALELGADWIELDVHLTRDGALAVIHDELVDRTTDGHGLVKDHTLAELKQLDAGAWFGSDFAGQRIPTLDEVLVWARARNTVVDIEIKNAPIYYAGIEEAVVESLDRAGMAQQVIVISFDHRSVQRVKALDSRIVTGVLYAARPTDGGLGLAHAAHADALLPHWAYVTPEDVQLAHDAGLAVAPWASSDPEILRNLVAAGVDAIGTNHPDVLRQILPARPDAGDSNEKSVVSPTVAGSAASASEPEGWHTASVDAGGSGHANAGTRVAKSSAETRL